MIKKILLGVCALTILSFVFLTPQAEARRHCRKSCSSIQFNVGAGYRTDRCVARCARPVIVPVTPIVRAAPVLPVYEPCYTYAPVAYAAPVYVEEVYVAPPRPFFGLGGLSFSWNFFK